MFKKDPTLYSIADAAAKVIESEKSVVTEKTEHLDEVFPGTPEYEKKHGKVVQDVKKGQTKQTTKGEVTGTGKGVVHKRKFSEMLDVYANGNVRDLLNVISEESTNDEFTDELKKAQAKSVGKDRAAVADPSVQAVSRPYKTYGNDSSMDEEYTLEDFTPEEIEDFIMSEEFEQLDELSKETLKSYYKKASSPYDKEGKPITSTRKILKRVDGKMKVNDRLAKESLEDFTPEEIEDFMQTEDFEQLDEVSKDTLKSYLHKSVSDLTFKKGYPSTPSKSKGNTDKEINSYNKRVGGVTKALKRMDEDAEQIQELRLKTLQTYRGKATEKLGHETKEKDDVRKAGIGRAGTKIKGKLSGLPFDGPYDDAKGTVTDKSGAKHDEYSRVRDLARKSVKEDLEAIAAKKRSVLEVTEPIVEASYRVVHDGVPADHKDETIRKLFAGKKNVTNHITRYEDSAKDRAELLKKSGFNNVRIDKTGK